MNFLLKSTAALLAGLLATGLSYGQAPANLWSKGYGGSRSDILNAIIPDAAGGFTAAGTTTSENGDIAGKVTGSTDNDWWVVQFSDTGAILRQRLIGSTGSDFLYAIRPLRRGGYIAAGFLSGNTRNFTGVTVRGGMDAAILKLDDTLGIVWVKAYGGSGSESFYDIQEAADGRLVACGYTNSSDGDITHKLNGTTDDWWIMTADTAGNIQSSKTYGGSGPSSLLYQERAYSIQCDPVAGYVATGTSSSNDGTLSGRGLGQNDIWVLKLDDTLGISWQQTLGGTNADIGATVIVAADSNYVVAGNTKSTDGFIIAPKGGGQPDVWVAKLHHSTGDTLWTRSYGGTKNDATNGFRAIRPTLDGGYVIAASSSSMDLDVSGHYGGSTNAYSDCWLVKLAPGGDIQWERNLGSTAIDNPNEVQQLADGSYIFLGQSAGTGGEVGTNKGSTDVFLTKIAPCPAYSYISVTICEGHPYLFNGIAQGNAGVYYDTLSMVSGCDSIVRLSLQVNPSVTTELRDTICKGGSYVFNGKTLDAAGIYIDTFTQAATGCDSFARLTLVVISIIKPVISALADTLSTGSYAAYQWLDAAGAPIAAATGKTYIARSSGVYRVAVMGVNGCSDTSDVYHHTGTGIATGALDGVRLYPNPARESLQLYLPAAAGPAIASLAAANGTIVYSNIPLQAGNNQLSLEALSPGIYMIRIISPQGSSVLRILKQ